MITLVSGFFVAYFALIKFLAGSESVQLSTLGVDPTSAGSPPVLFIISIIAFVVSYTPIAPKKLDSITDLLALERYKKSNLWMKRQQITAIHSPPALFVSYWLYDKLVAH